MRTTSFVSASFWSTKVSPRFTLRRALTRGRTACCSARSRCCAKRQVIVCGESELRDRVGASRERDLADLPRRSARNFLIPEKRLGFGRVSRDKGCQNDCIPAPPQLQPIIFGSAMIFEGK